MMMGGTAAQWWALLADPRGSPLAALAWYLAAVLAYLALALCGSHECFRGTWVAGLHYAATDGLLDGVEWLARAVGGRRGAAALARLEALCCRRKNPAGALFFLALLGGAYAGAAAAVFPLLPAPGLPAWHVAAGTGAAAGVLALFLAVSLADPGVVTPANAAAHAALYPPDGVLFRGAACRTCGTPKPARSKHCAATRGCVARFDHWCLWINNAVGLLNTRLFLAFLAATAGAAAYGAALGWAAVAADMERRGAWRARFANPDAPGRTVALGDGPAVVARYVAAAYPGAAALVAMLGLAAVVVAAFFAMQLHRVLAGVTTNEAFKWQDLAEAARAAAEAAAPPPPAGQRRRRRPPPPPPPPNAYDRGWRRNLGEVLFPRRHLAAALAARHKEEGKRN